MTGAALSVALCGEKPPHREVRDDRAGFRLRSRSEYRDLARRLGEMDCLGTALRGVTCVVAGPWGVLSSVDAEALDELMWLKGLGKNCPNVMLSRVLMGALAFVGVAGTW